MVSLITLPLSLFHSFTMEQQRKAIASKIGLFLEEDIPSPQSIFIQDSQSIDFTIEFLRDTLPSQTPFISTSEAYNARLVVERILTAYNVDGASTNPVERLIDGLSNFQGDFTKRYIVITEAHRLKNYDNLLIPLLRLPEIIQLPFTLIMTSRQPFTTLRPTNGLSPDPILVNIPPVSSKDIHDYLIQNCPSDVGENLHSTYQALCNFIMSSTTALNTQPKELLKITRRAWPKFIEPWTERDARPTMRDNELLTLTFARASRGIIQSINSNLPDNMDLLQASLPTDLTRCAQLLLIASYLASYNPPKQDVQMLSISLDKQKLVHRRKDAKSRPAQQLLGPKNFSFDRWLHIYGALLHFINDTSLTAYSLTNLKNDHRVFTDNELGQVDVLQNISHLTRIKMVQRTCPYERLDGMTFKCAIGYHVASNLANSFGVKLHEFLWDIS
ncbi:hypothetical protein E3Q16_02484 [Wallemia mellicola]|nr:hypothetical protein E3Q16_02484 [Wallemia mellicola]TIC17142.1 hypothetical protein E3Q13_02622 [Wallemia mellicola]